MREARGGVLRVRRGEGGAGGEHRGAEGAARGGRGGGGYREGGVIDNHQLKPAGRHHRRLSGRSDLSVNTTRTGAPTGSCQDGGSAGRDG